MTNKYTNQDIWDMGAENTAKLLNQLVEENRKLKLDKSQHWLDALSSNPMFYYPQPIGGYCDNIYHRTSRQLKQYLKDNNYSVDNVSRSSVGSLNFYHVEFNIPNDEWEYEQTSSLHIKQLLKIENIGLVDFYKQNGIVHEVILIDEKELNDKYLKNGNLVFR